MVALGIPMYFALYIAHRKVDKEFAMLAMIISFIAGAIFFATNRALPMLELSRYYAQATTEYSKQPGRQCFPLVEVIVLAPF